MTFNGFISYSHAADGRLAPAVQRGLHRLAKPWHRRRALWIFRDQTGLSVTPALWSSIQNALDGSDYFVLLASPEAARSLWVNREIEHWIATKSPDQILPVVTDGEWAWDPELRDFTPESTAVPASLRGVFTEEPLFLDLRWARGSEHLSLQHSRFRDAIAQLAAPMHGVSKDELEGEDVRQHRRARRLRSGAVATLMVLTLVATLTGVSALRNAERARNAAAEALRQQRVAQEQRGSAERSAQEASRQQELAKQQQSLAQQQQTRATTAAAEAAEAERLAQEQRELADKAAAEAKRQQQIADRAAKRTREQQRLAAEASQRAQRLEQEAQRQEAEARRQEAEARRLAKVADEQQRLAKEAAAEAKRQQAKADQQQRVAVSRRLINQAAATVGGEPKTALMLGAAAQKLAPGIESRSGLTGVIGSTSFAGTINDVTAAVYGRNGILVTRGTDGTVSLWNATDRTKPVRLSTLRDSASDADALTFSPDRRILALADARGKAVLYDVADPSGPVRLGPLPTDGEVSAITFGANGRMIAVGDGLGFTTLWDLTDPARPDKLVTLTEWGSHAVQDLAFSPDARLLVANKTRFVPVYDLTDRRNPKALFNLPSFMVGPITFLPGGSTVLSGDYQGTVNVYDLTEEWPEEMMWDLDGLAGTVRALTMSDDGRLVAAADGDGTALVWDMSNVEGARVITSVRAPAGINTVSFDNEGDTLVTTDSTRTATLWSVPFRGAPDRLAVHTDPAAVVKAATLHSDGRSLVAAQESGKAHLWTVTDPARPVRGRDLTLHDSAVRSVAFSPDGRTAAAAGQLDGRLTLTDLTRPERPVRLTVLTGFVAAPYELVFSSDGRTLAVITSTSVTLWDLTTRTRPRLLTTLSGGASFGSAAAFSPDGRTLVTSGADRTLTVWNVADRAVPVRLTSLAGHSSFVRSVAFSPDGRTVASGSDDATAMLWDVTDPARPHRLATLTGHMDGLATVAFSPDGRTLATGDDDYALTLWDTANPVAPIRLTTVRGLVGAAVEVMFRRDGHTLAIAAQNGKKGATVSLWNSTKLKNLRADPAKYACAITSRGLTAGEWSRYVPEFPYQKSCA